MNVWIFDFELPNKGARIPSDDAKNDNKEDSTASLSASHKLVYDHELTERVQVSP